MEPIRPLLGNRLTNVRRRDDVEIYFGRKQAVKKGWLCRIEKIRSRVTTYIDVAEHCAHSSDAGPDYPRPRGVPVRTRRYRPEGRAGNVHTCLHASKCWTCGNFQARRNIWIRLASS